MTEKIKQYKMSNGDEIVITVMEYNQRGGIIKGVDALRIEKVQSADGGMYYVFRPWMTLQHGKECVHIISEKHIIASANPAESILEQYLEVVEAIEKDSRSDDQGYDDLDSDDEKLFSDFGRLMPGSDKIN